MSEPSGTLPRRGFLGRVAAALTGGVWPADAGAGPAGAASEAQIDDQPYVAEIRMFAGSVPPSGWLFCEGQLLPIGHPDYETLWNLIGTTYGGDGQTTFGLPDLRGRAPVHFGNGVTLAETGGTEALPLVTAQIPVHAHALGAGTVPGNSDQPSGRVPTRNGTGSPVFSAAANTDLASTAVLPTGGSQPHPNMQPFLAIRFMISYSGVFPSPS